MGADFRRAEPADEPFLEEMLRLAIGWRDGTRGAPSPESEKYVRDYGRPGDRGIVAVDAGTPVGAAWYRLFGAGNHAYGYVRDDIPELALAVRPRSRRSGVATGLLTRLLKDATAQGFSGVSLSVDPENPARLLYERLDFVKVDEVEGSWTMLRSLG